LRHLRFQFRFSSYPYKESDGRGERALIRGEHFFVGAYYRKGVHLLERARLFELIWYAHQKINQGLKQPPK